MVGKNGEFYMEKGLIWFNYTPPPNGQPSYKFAWNGVCRRCVGCVPISTIGSPAPQAVFVHVVYAYSLYRLG